MKKAQEIVDKEAANVKDVKSSIEQEKKAANVSKSRVESLKVCFALFDPTTVLRLTLFDTEWEYHRRRIIHQHKRSGQHHTSGKHSLSKVLRIRN